MNLDTAVKAKITLRTDSLKYWRAAFYVRDVTNIGRRTPTDFIIDSGAAHTILSHTTLTRLGYNIHKDLPAWKVLNLTLANGKVAQFRQLPNLLQIEYNGILLAEVRAVCLENPAELNVIGLDVLNNYSQIVVNLEPSDKYISLNVRSAAH